MDEETKKEWEKSKRIEAEKMKAARAIAEEKPSQVNSAFLDVRNTSLKGYERNIENKTRSIERAGDFSVGMAILGMAVRFAIEMIPLPLGVLVQVVRLIGICILGISAVLAVGALGYAFYYRKKTEFKFKNVVITASIALMIVIIYVVLNFSLIKAEIML